MMGPRILFCVFVLILFPCFNGQPEETKPGEKEHEKRLELEVGVMGVYPAVQGNNARFSEYRDMKDGTVGAYGSVYLRYADPGGNFLKLDIRDPGYDTQYYRLDGGKWGSYRYSFFYKEIPHNISYNAITPYGGGRFGHTRVPGRRCTIR